MTETYRWIVGWVDTAGQENIADVSTSYPINGDQARERVAEALEKYMGTSVSWFTSIEPLLWPTDEGET